MKIICLQEKLKEKLSIVQNIIGKNLTLPILNNILLKTEKNRLKISSTNLEIGINTWIVGKIEKQGSITCPAKLLSDFVNNLPNKKLSLEAKNNSLIIKCDNYKAQIKGLNAKDFPIIPKVENKKGIKINNNILKTSLSQVIGMASVSESRPEISGILFSYSEGKLKIVATDSFRLAEKTISDIEKSDVNFSAILLQKTAYELTRILNDNDDVQIVLNNNQIFFESKDVQLISRIIEGQYPNYQQIIPKKFKTEIVFDKNELINQVKTTSLFSGRTNNINLTVMPEKSKVKIFAQDVDLGENTTFIKCTIKGRKLEIDFNYRYLLDGLSNIFSEKVYFGMNDALGPALIKPIGDNSYIYIVMPIKPA